MPIDISIPGFLKGQQAYADRMNTLAQAGLQTQQARAKELENQETEGVQAVLQETSQFFTDKATGKSQAGQGIIDTDAEVVSPTDGYKRVADALSRAGFANKGQEMLDKAFETDKRIADIEKVGLEAEDQRLDNIIKGSEMFGRYFGGVQNDDELQASIAQVRLINQKAGMEVVPENLLQYLEKAGYEPNTMAYLNNSALSYKDQAERDRKQASDDNTTKYRQILSDNAAARLELAERAQAANEKHQEAIRKASGGKAANTPTKERREASSRALRGSVFKGASEKNIDVAQASDYVANMATAILRDDTTGLTEDEAIAQAIIAGKDAGKFQVTTERHMFSEATRTPAFKSGTTPETASPVPKDRALVRKNHYYTMLDPETKQPVLAQWDGSDFVIVEGEEPAAPAKSTKDRKAQEITNRERAAL